MKFQIAKSFERSLKAFYVKNDDSFNQIQITLMKIGSCYSSNGLNFEKISEFYSFRVNDDIRIIGLKVDDMITLVYVDHHDKAYRWCSQNKPVISTNGYIGYYENNIKEESPNNLNKYNYLSDYGFEQTFIDLLNKSTQNELKNIIRFLSPEYQQLIIAGKKQENLITKNYVSDVIVINDDCELDKAIKLCYDEWAVFLHSKQKDIVSYPSNKNLLIEGGPGTGKTIALIWRYVHIYNLSKPQFKPVIIYRNETTKKVLENLIKKLDVKVNPIFLNENFRNNYNEFKNKHIFLDETQDMSINQLTFLFDSLHKANAHFTAAIDCKQAIVSIHDLNKKRDILVSYANNIIQLNYCYRSTEQIINRAYNCFKTDIEAFNLKNKPICPLYGNELIKKIFSNYSQLKEFILEDLNKNNLDVDSKVWGIIIVGNQNDFNNFMYGTDLKFQNNCFTPTTCKGLEFLYGYVVYIKGFDNCRKKECKKFVAISRFRDSFVEIEMDNKNFKDMNI